MVHSDNERCWLKPRRIRNLSYFPGLNGLSMSTWVTASPLFSLVSSGLAEGVLRAEWEGIGRHTPCSSEREEFPWHLQAVQIPRGLKPLRGGAAHRKSRHVASHNARRAYRGRM